MLLYKFRIMRIWFYMSIPIHTASYSKVMLREPSLVKSYPKKITFCVIIYDESNCVYVTDVYLISFTTEGFRHKLV